MELVGLKHGGRDAKQRYGAEHERLEPEWEFDARFRPADYRVLGVRHLLHERTIRRRADLRKSEGA